MPETLAHLTEKAAAYLLRDDAERSTISDRRNGSRYDGANAILERLESLLVHPKSHRMPNLLVVGDTNNGKTMLLKRFCKRHPAYDNKEGEVANVPVLFVQAPPVPDEGRFYNAILELLLRRTNPAIGSTESNIRR